MSKIFVTVFYVGFLPYAPGSFGSLAGVIIGLYLQMLGGFLLLICAIIAMFLLGWELTHRYISKTPTVHDPQEIVIDEVVGQLVSYLPISLYIFFYGSESFLSTQTDWLITFVLFRSFDIWKPWPVNVADKMSSALGIMLDDLLAGLYAGGIIIGIIILF